jgi:transglutaminase-like putative cysteine protease
MTERNLLTYLTAAIGVALGWVACCSWRGMILDPGRFTGPALVAAAVVLIVGATARSMRLRWYAVLAIQVVVLISWLHHHLAADRPLDGWLPTPEGIARIIDRIRSGATEINTLAAPLPVRYVDASVYLLVLALLVILAVDAIACGLERPAWSGLPVLFAITVPISVLAGGLPDRIYAATGLLFALLLAVVELSAAWTWGGAGSETASAADRLRHSVGLGSRALAIGTAATAIALALSLGVPIGDGLFRTHEKQAGGSSGTGPAATPGPGVLLIDPLVDMRRDLVREVPVPLLDATTDAADPSYLRMTVLDQFNDGTWVPSGLPVAETPYVEGPVPQPPGTSESAATSISTWHLQTTKYFATAWLPVPTVTRSISIANGAWHYADDANDIATADAQVPIGVRYQATAAAPTYTAAELDRSATAPRRILAEMTSLPPLPAVVDKVARKVTAAGRTQYAKAVLLQDWFRISGGFTYSLKSAPGSGLAELARFITTDKVGYCEQFAAAMAVMARALGIPARVVVGFLSPRKILPGQYSYSSDDLHAWPEIYFGGSGWVRFEPTPASRTGAAPSWTSTAPPTSVPPKLSHPTAPAHKLPLENDAHPGPSQRHATGNAMTTFVFAGAGFLVLLLGSAPTLIRRRQRRRIRVCVESLWAELRATSIDLGLPWPAGRSARMVASAVRSWIETADGPVLTAQDHESLDTLTSLVERARYQDYFVLAPIERAAAIAAVAAWSGLMAASVKPWRCRVAMVAPLSVLADDREPEAAADRFSRVG